MTDSTREPSPSEATSKDAVPPDAAGLPPNAIKLPQAAAFLGMKPRTVERLVQQQRIPHIAYEAVRVAPRNAETRRRAPRRIIAFDPEDLVQWREQRKLGRTSKKREG